MVNSSFAQTAEDSVKNAIKNMFAAMKNSDPIALKNCFTDSAFLQSITRDKSGKIVAKTESVDDFAKQVASLPVNAADEQIVFDGIKIDGPLATAWTPYNLYLNGKFIHCGVNTFVLLKQENIWKIQYIIDTRRRQGCKQ